MTTRELGLGAMALCGVLACSGDSGVRTSDDVAAADTVGADAGDTADATADGQSLDGAGGASAPLASCGYRNAFSQAEECKEYIGEEWTAEAAMSDCDAPSPGSEPGSFALGRGCGFESELGRCAVGSEVGFETEIVFSGDDESACAASRTGCEVFGGGTFAPSLLCEGSGGGGAPIAGVFQQPFEACVPPLEGEAAGGGADGEVCTRVAISGCTEEGRRFVEYGDCDVVRTQRPYYPVPGRSFEADPNDPRLDDEDYMAELEWARDQVASCGCVCCHSDAAPSGPSSWTIEPTLWVDTVPDSGLALFANWVDSASLGAYPAEDNAGFDRSAVGLPSTDPARLRAFIEQELDARGFTESDAGTIAPFGGPIYDQLVYTPRRCAGGEGVDDGGRVRWGSGQARYVYVLEPESANPGVPPNLDLPVGTVWRVDVAASAPAIGDGFVYGSAPVGATQRYPESGPPRALEPGGEYYLYVLLDVGIPLTRCLFTAPS